MSGNYQSRVFTFINKRTNELKNNCAKGWRHIKVAVVWSGQVLLYPIQLLAQTAKIFQPELPAPPQRRSLPFQPVPDINIEQALDLVAESGYPIEIALPTALAIKQQSSIDRRKVNLTTAAITIADEDYLPEEWDWDERSLHKSHQVTRNKPIVRGLSSLLIDRQLVLVTTENELLDILTLTQQQEIRRRIGMDLAIDWHQWHHQQLSTDRTDKQLATAKKSLLLDGSPIEQKLLADRDNISPNLSERLQNWWRDLTIKPSMEISNSLAQLELTEPDLAPQLAPSSYSFTPQPPRSSRFLDLPQLPPFIEEALTPQRHRPVLETIAQLQPNWLKQWWSYYREYWYIPNKSDLEIIHQPSEFQLTPVVRQSDLKIETVRKTKFRATSKHQSLLGRGAGQLSNQNYHNLEYQPDWIEVTSEPIGYKTSLLAKLLVWLDRIMLNIENWLIEIWRLITDRTIKD
ncbi:hypothetical protein [Chamaesiphon sp. OTE_8_metabat_110]|uniref:hypothetical protein n=1 Tax=Chamaesiphon sp. OTE_8_metabat_110 TaxID=2964696 RepID=UPI00286D58A0|nr:hypothetical protein [Chamaesiphon sp. OTE_8_metabat_110]